MRPGETAMPPFTTTPPNQPPENLPTSDKTSLDRWPENPADRLALMEQITTEAEQESWDDQEAIDDQEATDEQDVLSTRIIDPIAPPTNGRFDETLRNLVCQLIRQGMSRRRAAGYVGIHHSTVTKAAKRDPLFGQQLRDAHLSRELAPLENIEKAGQRSWRASAWLLERMDPKQYGRPSQIHSEHHLSEMGREALYHLANAICDELELSNKKRSLIGSVVKEIADQYSDEE